MSDDVNAVAFQLVKRLYERTRSGAVPWEPLRKDMHFMAKFPDYVIVFSAQDDPEFPDSPDYILEIRDEQNRQVDLISNYTLKEVPEQIDGKNTYQVLEETHRMARRQALGSDKALASLLKQLG